MSRMFVSLWRNQIISSCTSSLKLIFLLICFESALPTVART